MKFSALQSKATYSGAVQCSGVLLTTSDFFYKLMFKSLDKTKQKRVNCNQHNNQNMVQLTEKSQIYCLSTKLWTSIISCIWNQIETCQLYKLVQHHQNIWNPLLSHLKVEFLRVANGQTHIYATFLRILAKCWLLKAAHCQSLQLATAFLQKMLNNMEQKKSPLEIFWTKSILTDLFLFHSLISFRDAASCVSWIRPHAFFNN